MFEGLYNSATGMISQSVVQKVIATNIAKAVLPGYKKQTAVQSPFQDELAKHSEQVGGTKVKQIYTSFTQGSIKQTNNPLDIAVTGDGFFVVHTKNSSTTRAYEDDVIEGTARTENSQYSYTRNGRLSISQDGVLVTLDGYPVMGENGEISIRGGGEDLAGSHQVIIDKNGQVSIQQDNQSRVIDTLRVVDFKEYTKVTPIGNSLFDAGDQTPVAAENFSVEQGFIEQSNVSILDEMVSMISNMRLYESNQKALRSISESLQRSIAEIGRV